MFAAATLAFADLFTPPFRATLLKTLALTLALLVVAFIGFQALLGGWLAFATAWLEPTILVATGIAFMVAAWFLIPPITSLIASLFLDEIAAVVERTHYASDPPGRALPLGPSLWLSIRFFVLVLSVNVLTLLLLLVPGVNIFAFLVANGYLLGREYFELVAFRRMPIPEARALRARHGTTAFMAGLVIAGFVAIPFLNLAAPLFATAFMVHLQKRTHALRRPGE